MDASLTISQLHYGAGGIQNKSPLRKGGGQISLSYDLRILAKPFINFARCLILGVSIALLNSTDQFFALALDHLKVVIGQLGPLLLDLACKLFPVALDAIPIHRQFSVVAAAQCAALHRSTALMTYRSQLLHDCNGCLVIF